MDSELHTYTHLNKAMHPIMAQGVSACGEDGGGVTERRGIHCFKLEEKYWEGKVKGKLNLEHLHRNIPNILMCNWMLTYTVC